MSRTSTSTSKLAAVTLAAIFAAGVVACGGDDSSEQADSLDDGGATAAPTADAGKSIANDSGCQACHHVDGGGVGPAWLGLYGSTVTLEDGSTVEADDDYLRRAISDPGAQVVDGFNVSMPDNSLTSDQIDAVIAYIRSLNPSAEPIEPVSS